MIAVLISSLGYSEITVEFFGFPIKFDMEEGSGTILFFLYWIFMVSVILAPFFLVIAFLGGIFEMKIEALNESYRANLWTKYQAELLYSSRSDVSNEVTEENENSRQTKPEKNQEKISVDIPEGTTCFQFCEFNDYINLQLIVIPKSMSFIASSAFRNCKALKDVYYRGSEEEWKAIKIYGDNEPLLNANIHYNYTGQ